MEANSLPRHVAIIMDGNGRWAKSKNLPRTKGHLEGVKRVEEIVRAARETGIQVLTLYAFSTENWARPKQEVSMLMNTFISVLNQKVRKLHESNVKLQFIGKKVGVPENILKSIVNAAELTKDNTGMVLNVAFNYGSRLEIQDAIMAIAREVKDGQLQVDRIDESVIDSHLYTRGLPDPDLLIRTSGEKRISNFLLWQLSYAEFYFTEKYWPDFTKDEFEKALVDFQKRERRYGNISAKGS